MFMQNLDTIVAFAVLMLLLSLVITTVVQLLVSLFGLRGRQLIWGVSTLLEQAGATDKATAQKLAGEVLTHPALAPTRNWLTFFPEWIWDKITGQERHPLTGKRPPTAISKKDIELVLESLKGKDSSSAAKDVNVVKLEEWFDTVMEATSEKFKLWSRWITAGGAIILASAFQVDSLEIMNQLNSNSVARAQLVSQAVQVQELYDELDGATANNADQEQLDELKETLGKINTSLDKSTLDILDPVVWNKDDDWTNNLFAYVPKTSGTVMTILLLSLGAPFWYGALSKLLNFRSLVVRKQGDQQQPDSS